MKKIIAMAIAALFITVAANAQIQRIQDSTFEKNRPVHHKKMVKDNWNKLDLTDAQKKQMKENQERFKTQREAVKNDASLTQEQKKSKMMEIQKASREMNEKILTKEQKEAMKANQGKRSGYGGKGRQQMKDDKGRMGHGMKNQGMKGEGMKQLDLSQDQQAKMKDLRTKMQEESAAIKNNSKLTEEQKKQQMKDLRRKNMDEMNKVLTPEQRMKMKENRDDHKQGNHKMKNRKKQSQ